MSIEEIIDYMREELEAARRDMFSAYGGSCEYNRIATEAKYSYIAMICNDIGIDIIAQDAAQDTDQDGGQNQKTKWRI